MSWKSAVVWVVLFAVLALIGTRVVSSDDQGDKSTAPAANRSVDATITRVVDGDTVKARLPGGEQRTVRYIGVDTPETVKPGEAVQCFGKAASAFNRRLVQGKRVRLRIGRERFDRYRRLLAYVYVEEPRRTFVNAELIARGYARTLTIAPNTNFAGLFARLQRRAQRLDIGLWRACPALGGR